jgi:hypothetical protein
MRRASICRVVLLLVFLIAVGGVAGAQVRPVPVGEWVLRLGPRTFIVLSLKGSGGVGQAVAGSLTHPQHYSTSDGESFSHVSGGLEVEPILTSEWKGDALAFTVVNPADAKDTDGYLFRVKDAAHATLQYADLPLSPMELIKADGPVAVAADWDAEKVYSVEDGLPSNAEMKRIFEEDQKVREAGFKIDWAVVSKSDAERRKATMELVKTGALHTGEDFTWAAFLFQHGDGPDDYLLAHTLAMIAVKKGRGDALWIATATLDRYLQSVKQAQIYGTQFVTLEGKPTTQEPYERGLVSDALRKQLGVPSLAAQDEQRKAYDAERKVAK